MNDLEKHIAFWRDYTPECPPYIHPQDRDSLTGKKKEYFHKKPFDLNGFLEGPWNVGGEKHFHTGLLPVPHLGDLQSAKAVVLMTNPGFHISDYWAEQDSAFVRDLKGSLHQNFEGNDFPFMFLDPKYCWHGGFLWWESKFRSIANKLWERLKLDSYKHALKYLSQNVAAIELMPYHSISARFMDMPSVRSARKAAAYLGSDENRKLHALIVARSAKQWAAPDNPKVTVLSSGQARSASLKLGSVAGDAILKALL